MLSHKAQTRPPGFLNFSSEKSRGVAGSRLSPRLGQCLTSKGFSHIGFIRINSTHYQSLTEDLLRIRGLTALGKEGSRGRR